MPRPVSPVSHLLHEELTAHQELLAQTPTSANVFLPGGVVPKAGSLLVQSDLARSLGLIARNGAAAFYEGEIAQQIAEYMAANGGLMTVADLAGFEPQWKDPIHTAYRGVEFYGQPAPSQGFIIGQELNLLEGFDPRTLEASELLHVMVEAKKLSFADRLRYLGDPDFSPVPMETLLSKAHAERQRKRIGPKASNDVRALDLAPGGETTYLSVVDQRGNAISFIQSIFEGFGSGVVAGPSGVLLNDRMFGFNVQPGHPNCVAPRKRPAMTLNACMLFRDGRPWVTFGTPGADAQVQTNFQHAVDFVDFGMNVQEAIESPRWLHLPGNELALESRWPAAVLEGLKARGHNASFSEEWDHRMGGAQAIMIDHNNQVLHGGADPRREGYVIGY